MAGSGVVAGGSVSLSLPFSPASVGEARSELQDWLVQSGYRGPVVDDGRLVVSELVANAIRHAQPLADGRLVVAWGECSRGVEISVTDGGAPTYPHRINAAASSLAGRGLTIIDTVTSRWWTDRTRARSTVHAVLPVA